VSWQQLDTVIEILPSNAIILHKLNAEDGAILPNSGHLLNENDDHLITSDHIKHWDRFPRVSRLQQFLQSG
jgi:hypothetical protein